MEIQILRTRKNRELIASAAAVETPDCCYCEVTDERIHLSVLTLADGRKLHEKIQHKWYTNPEINTWLVFVCLEDSSGHELPDAKWSLEEMAQERKNWLKVLAPKNKMETGWLPAQ